MGSLSAGLDNMLRLALLLALSVFSTGAQNINCGQRTRRVIPVDVNQTFSFTSQRKGFTQYLPDTDCRALYKQGPNCHTIEFSCSQVAVKAGWKKPAKPESDRYCWGDFMKVRRYGQKQRYCRNAKPAPEFNSTGPITVFFRAKADHKVSTGAVCKIECTEDNSMYKGVIESQNYPMPYGSNSTSKTVKTTTGHVLQFTIKDFDVSPSDSFFQIKDSGGSTICSTAGGANPVCTGTLTTTTNEASVTHTGFQGTPPNTDRGFMIVWKAIPDPTLRSLDLDNDYLDYDLEALEEEYSE